MPTISWQIIYDNMDPPCKSPEQEKKERVQRLKDKLGIDWDEEYTVEELEEIEETDEED